MDKTILGLLGAASTLAVATSGASASTNPTSYAELLKPIPDATTLLKQDDAQRAQAGTQVADVVIVRRSHRHHHHHRYHHHHHHHHHFER